MKQKLASVFLFFCKSRCFRKQNIKILSANTTQVISGSILGIRASSCLRSWRLWLAIMMVNDNDDDDDGTAAATQCAVESQSMSVRRRYLDDDHLSDGHAEPRHRAAGVSSSTTPRRRLRRRAARGGGGGGRVVRSSAPADVRLWEQRLAVEQRTRRWTRSAVFFDVPPWRCSRHDWRRRPRRVPVAVSTAFLHPRRTRPGTSVLPPVARPEYAIWGGEL